MLEGDTINESPLPQYQTTKTSMESYMLKTNCRGPYTLLQTGLPKLHSLPVWVPHSFRKLLFPISLRLRLTVIIWLGLYMYTIVYICIDCQSSISSHMVPELINNLICWNCKGCIGKSIRFVPILVPLWGSCSHFVPILVPLWGSCSHFVPALFPFLSRLGVLVPSLFPFLSHFGVLVPTLFPLCSHSCPTSGFLFPLCSHFGPILVPLWGSCSHFVPTLFPFLSHFGVPHCMGAPKFIAKQQLGSFANLVALYVLFSILRF